MTLHQCVVMFYCNILIFIYFLFVSTGCGAPKPLLNGGVRFINGSVIEYYCNEPFYTFEGTLNGQILCKIDFHSCDFTIWFSTNETWFILRYSLFSSFLSYVVRYTCTEDQRWTADDNNDSIPPCAPGNGSEMWSWLNYIVFLQSFLY